MEQNLYVTVRNAALVLIAGFGVLASGCGDGFLNRGGGMFDSMLARRTKEQMRGDEVELLEYTGCAVLKSDDPEARCEGVSDMQIEVFVDGESIIFDFSNVEKDGTISEADFEGYVVSLGESSNLPPILEAIVDAAVSKVDPKTLDLDFDDRNVAVNLQGLRYDQGTFIKVDLVFDEAS
ncbi:MAG: hypothetical protein AMS21_01270 [Gemmatimonas sp. SG8_38_2]|nr:MAG: hypothetical protein AMS21_01270 [Gemmatimonas sp. SG8_38_2]